MAKKMLIDATHAEETRVVVVDGNKVEEFDFESENKRQLAGNIYLAKVTRVEPSLQAAFVEYGGNRHGFLAFSEVHPDYYQIPVADREALLAEENAYAEAQRELENNEEEHKSKSRSSSKSTRAQIANSEDFVQKESISSSATTGLETIELIDEKQNPTWEEKSEGFTDKGDITKESEAESQDFENSETRENLSKAIESEGQQDLNRASLFEDKTLDAEPLIISSDASLKDNSIENVAELEDEFELRPVHKTRPRRYKIQEVIKTRQILLVQVVKEERGNKGAALTTYLSLAGRYCVLMPNTARGGGISRKITNAADRKKLKEIAVAIDVPEGAGLIIRTAGAKRTKIEIKRDYEYLQRLWEQIRELTLKSVAPSKIYEEGDLIKRSIRDLYNREIDEVLVEGERGYRIAKDFMKMIMPSHAKNVKNYHEVLPLFVRYQVESYLGSMFNPVVQLKSGGYIVIGVTEALVAVDVNSGRATKEASIEETALKTNLEAADEVARQLRLRDLAGLIVIDFIDMDERKNNSSVEKRMKDRLKTDRARIQLGRISGFGLLEMSRQRLRPGMLEATTKACPHCHGTGLIRSEDNVALAILRQIEEEGVRQRSREVLVKCPVSVANFLINQKREHIFQIESRYGLSVQIEGVITLVTPEYEIEKFKQANRSVPKPRENVVSVDAILHDKSVTSEEAETEDEEVITDGSHEPDDTRPKKKRRRRRRRRSKNELNEDANIDNPENPITNQQSDESELPEKNVSNTTKERAKSQVGNTSSQNAGEEALLTEVPKKSNRQRRTRANKTSKETATGDKTLSNADRKGVALELITDEATLKEFSNENKPEKSQKKPALKNATTRKTRKKISDNLENINSEEKEASVNQKKDKTKITLVADTPETELVQNETEDGTKKKSRRKGWWSRRESNE